MLATPFKNGFRLNEKKKKEPLSVTFLHSLPPSDFIHIHLQPHNVLQIIQQFEGKKV